MRGTKPLPPTAELLLMFAARAVHLANHIEPHLASRPLGGMRSLHRCHLCLSGRRARLERGSHPPVGNHGARHAPSGSDRACWTRRWSRRCERARQRNAGAATDRFESERVEFFERVRAAYRARAAAEPERIAVDRCAANRSTQSPREFSNCWRRGSGFLERRFAALAARRAATPARRARGRAAAAFAAAAVRARASARSNWRVGSTALALVRVAGVRGPAASVPPAGCCARTVIRMCTWCASRRTRSRSRSIRCAN